MYLRLITLLFHYTISHHAYAQDWRIHLDSLRLASDTIQGTYPFDDPIDGVYPADIIGEFQWVMISSLEKLAALNIPLDSITNIDMIDILPIEGTNASILQWDAKTGGSFQQVYVYAWIESDGQSQLVDLGLSGYTQAIDVLQRDNETLVMLHTEVRGCNTCFEGTLSLVNLSYSPVTEAKLTIYSRSWEIQIRKVREDIYHFRGYLYHDAYLKIYRGNEMTYSSQDDPFFDMRYPAIDDEGLERIANGFIEFVDKREFRLVDHAIDDESSEMSD